MQNIKIKDQKYPVELPDFATREELVEAYANSGKSSRTVGYILVAITGVCCPSLLQGLELGRYKMSWILFDGAEPSILSCARMRWPLAKS